MQKAIERTNNIWQNIVAPLQLQFLQSGAPVRKVQIAVMVALSLASLVGCSEDTTSLKKEMIALDRIYISTLYDTMKNDTAASRKAINQLQISWERFNTAHYGDHADTTWRNSFDKVSGLISRADGVLNTSGQTQAAHEALEGVRVIMGRLRKSYGVTIFTDYLTDFHEPMEAIVLATKGVIAETLTDSLLNFLQEKVAEVNSMWAVVETAPVDTALYGVTSADLAALRDWIGEESAQLKALKEALGTKDKLDKKNDDSRNDDSRNDDSRNKETIIILASALKPPFVKIYTFFGGQLH